MSQVNINIEHLKKMTTAIASNHSMKHNLNDKLNVPNVANVPKIMKRPNLKPVQVPHVQVQAPIANESCTSDTSKVLGDCEQTSKNLALTLPKSNTDAFSIMGISLPKQTLYLALVLIIIAIAIWYMNREKPKKKKKHEEDD